MGRLKRGELRSPETVLRRPYECLGCGEQFRLEHYVCPECGGFSVERRRPGRRQVL